MDYDDYRSEDPMRSAALVAATRCRVDYEPPSWEPETDAECYAVCEHREICKRAFDLCAAFVSGAHEMLRCSECRHFEDSGVTPV